MKEDSPKEYTEQRWIQQDEGIDLRGDGVKELKNLSSRLDLSKKLFRERRMKNYCILEEMAL